jgi:hypothetical protein
LSKKQEVIKQQLRQFYIQAKVNRDTDKFYFKAFKACFNDKMVLKALITLIVI